MNSINRLGIYYFQDNHHYHKKEAERWLPILQRYGFQWLVLQNSGPLAIPAPFIEQLHSYDIHPVIHFHLDQHSSTTLRDLEIILKAYQEWGVCYVLFFNSPNTPSFWTKSSWASENIVEDFIDLFIPYAETALTLGLSPIFPPLEVAKGFWDTAFLRLSMESLTRRGCSEMANHLTIGAFAEIHNPSLPLSWGAGGPERWPEQHPYQFSPQSQDHRGLHIFEWYNAILKSVLGISLPLMMFEQPASGQNGNSSQETSHRIGKIVQWLMGSESTVLDETGIPLNPIPEEVLCFNFHKLASSAPEQTSPQDWFSENTEPNLPAIEARRVWRELSQNLEQNTGVPNRQALLLPRMEEDQLRMELEKIQPFLLQKQPDILFSLEDVSSTKTIFILEGLNPLSERDLSDLQQSGYTVHMIPASGTSLASDNIS
jgi:hypothetical protein